MKYYAIAFLLIGVICLSSGCLLTGKAISVSPKIKPMVISYNEAENLASDTYDINNMCRASQYSGVMLTSSTNFVYIGVFGTKRTIIPRNSRCFGDDTGNVVAWFTDLGKDGIHFSDGKIIKLEVGERVGFAPGCFYYYLYSELGTQIFDITNHNSVVSISFGMYPQKLITHDKDIYIFMMRTTNRIGKAYEHKGFHYRLCADGSVLIKSFDLPGAVIDMSSDARYFIIDNGSDIYAKWYLYDVETKKKQFLSRREYFGCFIDKQTWEKIKSGIGSSPKE